jgi:hypothetical protein
LTHRPGRWRTITVIAALALSTLAASAPAFAKAGGNGGGNVTTQGVSWG